MTLGLSQLGTAKLGSTTIAATPTGVGPALPSGQQVADLLGGESPLLQLYTITTKNGKVFRFVDFADPDEQVQPNDLFDVDTQQDFLATSEAFSSGFSSGFEFFVDHLHDWKTLNTTKATKFDVNITRVGHLVIENTDAEEPADWDDANRLGPYPYKLIRGDFSVYCEVDHPTSDEDLIAGILIQGENAPGVWLFNGVEVEAGGASLRLVYRVNQNSATSTDFLSSSGSGLARRFCRIQRVGDTFTLWSGFNPGASNDEFTWNVEQTQVVTDVGLVMRVGCFTSRNSGATGTLRAEFKEFRFFRSQHGLDKVNYNNQIYTSAKIGKPKITQSLDGRIPSFNVTVLDPARLLLAFAKTNSLTDATIDLDIIHYDDLADPTKARSKKFRLRQVVAAEGPASMTINIGAPNLLDKVFPVIVSNRSNCHNRDNEKYKTSPSSRERAAAE